MRMLGTSTVLDAADIGANKPITALVELTV